MLKHAVAIYGPDDRLTDDMNEIREIQKTFYEELYTSDPNISFELDSVHIPKMVSPGSFAADETQFSEAEVMDAIKSMKNGSCPGSDGIPAEFYKMFWRDIKKRVHGNDGGHI